MLVDVLRAANQRCVLRPPAGLAPAGAGAVSIGWRRSRLSRSPTSPQVALSRMLVDALRVGNQRCGLGRGARCAAGGHKFEQTWRSRGCPATRDTCHPERSEESDDSSRQIPRRFAPRNDGRTTPRHPASPPHAGERSNAASSQRQGNVMRLPLPVRGWGSARGLPSLHLSVGARVLLQPVVLRVAALVPVVRGLFRAVRDLRDRLDVLQAELHRCEETQRRAVRDGK